MVSILKIVGFILILLFGSIPFAGPEDETKPSLEQVREFTLRHKERVKKMGFFIYDEFGKDFPELQKLLPAQRVQLLAFYLSLHDNPKLWGKNYLTTYGLPPDSRIPIEDMREYWGVHLASEQKGWVNHLNLIEGRYKMWQLTHFCKKLNIVLSEALRKELWIIEELADKFDTKLNRLGEVSDDKSPPKPYAAAEFFELINELDLARFARRLESRWHHRSCMTLFAH